MPRTARTIIEGIPYHVTQRGNRGQCVFTDASDHSRYLGWLKDYSERYHLEVLAYCLMSNHIHLVVIPKVSDSLAQTLRALQTRHSQTMNREHNWDGHLWQGRYYSVPLDERHLWAAVRYVERNPIRAGIVLKASDYPWSSASFHLGLRRDPIIKSRTEWGRAIGDWHDALEEPEDEHMLETIRIRTNRGFPCGDEDFINRLSEMLGHPIAFRPQGRPHK